MDIVRENQNIFAYIVDQFFSVPHHLKYYHTFYPRSEKSVYTFFKEAPAIQQSIDSEILYNAVKDSPDFDVGEFSLLMVKRHSSDNRFVKKYIETHDHTDDAEESLNQENVNPTPTLDK